MAGMCSSGFLPQFLLFAVYEAATVVDLIIRPIDLLIYIYEFSMHSVSVM